MSETFEIKRKKACPVFDAAQSDTDSDVSQTVEGDARAGSDALYTSGII